MKTIRHLGQNNRLRHGQTHEPEYYVWRTMKARCLNPRARMYHRYGGRGIAICDRWMLFDNFFADMGKRPSPKHQLDRINNDGNYDINNCRWATTIEQGRNKSTNVVVEYEGIRLTVAEWAERKGVSRYLVYNRIRKGWDFHLALTTPPTPRSERKKLHIKQ